MKWLALALIAACGHSSHSSHSSSSPAAPSTEEAVPEPESDPDPAPDEAPAEPAAPAPAPARKPAPAPAPTGVAQQWVDAHNAVRAKHCAAPLTWSPELAAIAQKWADTLRARGCIFEHSGGEKYGENLAGGTADTLGVQGAVDMWADEEKLYKFPNGGFSMQTGHFTQVVWTDTRKVGCGQVTCKGLDLFVCNYDPPGNWDGQYREHVLPKSCKK